MNDATPPPPIVPPTATIDCEDPVLRQAILNALAAAGLSVAVEGCEPGDGRTSEAGGTSLLVREGAASAGALSSIDPRLFQAVIDSIDQGLVVFGPDLKILFSNSQFTVLAEYPEALGQPGASIADGLRYDAERGVYGPGDPEQKVAEMLAGPRTAEPYRFERVLNSGRRLEIRRNPMPGGGVVAVHTDITEQATESEAHYKALAELSPDGIMVHTAGIIQFTNAAMARLLDVSGPGDLIGREAIAFVPDEDKDAVLRRREQAERGETRGYRETTYLTASGRVVHVERAITTITWRGDASFLVVTRDNTERKQAEDALKEREAKLYEILENSPVGVTIVTHDADGTRITGDRLFVNNALVRMFGAAARESFLTAKIEDSWVDLAQLKKVEEVFKARRELVDFAVQRRRLDGAHIWVSMNTRPILFEGQECTMVWHFDITERKQAEQALRSSEQRLRSIIDNSPAAIFLKDFESRYLLANRSLGMWYGLQSQDIVGKTTHDLFPRELADTFVAQDRIVIAEGGTREWEAEVPFSDGTRHNIHFIKFLVPGPEGGNAGIGVIGTDISEYRRAEEALRESEAQLRLVIDALPATIAYFDTSIRYRLVNKRTEERFGQPVSKILGKSLRDVVGEENERRFRPHVDAALAGERQTFETTVSHPDGHTREIEISYLPHLGANGNVLGFFALGLDVTERRALEEQLRQAQRMEAVGQLTGGVAHDFNNLLAVVQGNAELLSDTVGSDDPFASTILRATMRGAELTQRLLAFSRQQPLQPKTIDLAVLVDGMSDLLKRTLGETVEIETARAAACWNAVADPGQVEDALLNLSINARDAMPKGGRLTIECDNAQLDADYIAENPGAIAGDYVVLAVSDNGVGMSADVKARAFEPFFTTKDVGEGSGLGLSMVYGFAKQSGGHVSIYSEEGNGTTVKLYLPKAADTSAVAGAEVSAAIPRGRGETLLVIEDDPDVRGLAVRILTDLNYRLIDVADAAAAHAVLETGQPVQLVLSDVVLPGGTNGPEFAEEARARDPDLKVIFMSGYPAEAARRNGFLGSDKVLLNKPFQRRQLAMAVRDALA